MRFLAPLALTAVFQVACEEPIPNLAPQAKNTDRIIRGRELFAARCTLCHGDTGNGKGEKVAELDAQRPLPDFTDPAWRASSSLEQSYRAIRDGVPNTSMQAWEWMGTERMIDLTVYVHSIAR